jgi:hypothetical protein
MARASARTRIGRAMVPRAAPLACLVVVIIGALTACDPAPPYAGYSSPTYAQDQNWLCRPGSAAANACVGSYLDSTIVSADGTTQLHPFTGYDQSQPTAPIDCFYVYPTVTSSGDGYNDLAMSADETAEVQVVHEQAGRFTSVCNVYAPLYRQMRFSAYFAPSASKVAATNLAYGDVLDAFKHYMANFNHGRPVVLIGHSQGSQHLLHLLQNEFDNNAQLTGTLMSALLIGWHIETPPAGAGPGEYWLLHIPTCGSANQNGCLVNYQSFGTQTPAPGGTPRKVCVNPTAIGGGAGPIKAFVAPATVGGIPPVTTSTVELPGAMTGRCVVPATGAPYLSIEATQQPGDVRNLDNLLRGLNSSAGLHLNEVDLTQGNLIDLIRSQASGRGIALR